MQCKNIRVVDRFNTSWGLVFTVKDDGCIYRVGENVNADGVCYTITGIHMSPSPNSDLIGLRVEKVMDVNEDKCLDDDGWYLGTEQGSK